MEIVLALVVLLAALAALAYPLYRARTISPEVNASTLDDLLAERDGVYATLRDLELDKQLGKLNEADYAELRDRYMGQASEILQVLDALHGEGATAAASAEIEQQVAALRQRESSASTPKSKAAGAPDKKQELKCSNCGRPYRRGDQFCANCGRPLN